MKRILVIAATAALAALVCGCNTFQGIGADLQAGGRALSDAATGSSNGSSTVQQNNNSHPQQQPRY